MAALVGTAIVAVLPELVKTQEYIAKELDRLGISYKKNKNDSGIIGEIKGGHSGKTILFRADIDALPIREDTGVTYCSKHDGYERLYYRSLVVEYRKRVSQVTFKPSIAPTVSRDFS